MNSSSSGICSGKFRGSNFFTSAENNFLRHPSYAPAFNCCTRKALCSIASERMMRGNGNCSTSGPYGQYFNSQHGLHRVLKIAFSTRLTVLGPVRSGKPKQSDDVSVVWQDLRFTAAHWPGSGGGFGAEDSLEAGAGELDADVVLAGLLGGGYVDYAAAGGEILFRLLHAYGAAGGAAGGRDTDLEVGADSPVEAGDEGRSVAAKIFPGSFFLAGDAAGIPAAYL